MQAIDNQTLNILDSAAIDGNMVRLTCGQLDRKTYEKVNDVLVRIGGKWTTKAKAHIFADDPAPILGHVLTTGQMPPKNPLAYFATPAPIVARMIERIHLENDMQILEPSAGEGAICDGIRSVNPDAWLRCVEIDARRAAILRAKGYEVHEQDFLTIRSLMSFEAILMNPPFSVKGDPLAYISHIEHAMSLLAPWGRLVAIAPSGFTFRDDRRSRAFRNTVETRGGWEALDTGAFKASDTMANTVMLWINC